MVKGYADILRALADEIAACGDYPETWIDIPRLAADELEQCRANENRLGDQAAALLNEVVELRATINKAGGLASQGASTEIIRQVLAEGLQSTKSCDHRGSQTEFRDGTITCDECGDALTDKGTGAAPPIEGCSFHVRMEETEEWPQFVGRCDQYPDVITYSDSPSECFELLLDAVDGLYEMLSTRS